MRRLGLGQGLILVQPTGCVTFGHQIVEFLMDRIPSRFNLKRKLVLAVATAGLFSSVGVGIASAASAYFYDGPLNGGTAYGYAVQRHSITSVSARHLASDGRRLCVNAANDANELVSTYVCTTAYNGLAQNSTYCGCVLLSPIVANTSSGQTLARAQYAW